MKVVLVTLLAVLPLVAACGSDEPDTAVDPTPRAEAPPTPSPDGPVRTRDLVTVVQTADDDQAEMCLGAVAESAPPQCSGLPLAGWEWDQTAQELSGSHWGSYAVTGTWDGTTFAVTEAVPAALYDPAMPVEAPTPSPATAYSSDELDAIAAELQEQLPGATAVAYDGHVELGVTYDDGSIQEWADEQHTADVVLVTSALVDVEG